MRDQFLEVPIMRNALSPSTEEILGSMVKEEGFPVHRSNFNTVSAKAEAKGRAGEVKRLYGEKTHFDYYSLCRHSN